MAKTVSPVLLYGNVAWGSRLYTLYFLILRVLLAKTVSPVLLYGSEAWGSSSIHIVLFDIEGIDG